MHPTIEEADEMGDDEAHGADAGSTPPPMVWGPADGGLTSPPPPPPVAPPPPAGAVPGPSTWADDGPAWGPPAEPPRATGPGPQTSRALVVGVGLLVVAVLGFMGWSVLGTRTDRTRTEATAAVDGTEPAPAGAPDLKAGPEAADLELDQASIDDSPCTSIDPGAWRPATTATDLVAAVRDGAVPGPDATADDIGPPARRSEYPTAADFLIQSDVSDPAARAEAMEAAGYTGGIEDEYDGAVPTSVQVLAFRDAPSAASYVAARLPDLCRLRGTEVRQRLGDDGFAFVDGVGTVHGEFLLGGNQVSLVLCGCAPDDGIAMVAAWYEAWVARYGTPST
ncbi:MAG: hypothetical protein KDB04_16720 [Acidimicrobiales bacterium]|nr:hypothetical protein [Acidimicrobiales bacterium]HRW36141.1 hypothetical protein [Aquihabitans sp.]